MDKGDQTGIGGIIIGFGLGMGTFFWPWPIPDDIKHVLFWISAVFVLSGCLWLLDIHFLINKKKFYRRGVPLIFFIILACLIIFVERPKKLIPAVNPLDNQISFSCEWSQPPSEYRSDKNTYIYQLGDPPTFGGMPAPNAGATMFFASGSGPIPPAENKTDSNFEKCSFQNFSNFSLIGVQIVLWVSFREKVMTSKTDYKSGREIAHRLLFSPPLDLGPSESSNSNDYFYIWNPTEYFADVSLPTSVVFKLPGSLTIVTAKLLPAESIQFIGIFPDPNR